MVKKLAALAGMLMITMVGYGQASSDQGIFSHDKFTEVRLNDLTVRLGDPIQVTAQLGWRSSWQGYDWYSFIHLTPNMARFPNGELIATYALDPDSYGNPLYISGFQLSGDGGEHWGSRYSMLMQHMTGILVPEANNSLMAVPAEVICTTPGDEHNFRGPYVRFEEGGKRMVMEPDGVHVVDWPWPVGLWPGALPKSDWHVQFQFTGSAVKVGDQLLAAVNWVKKGEAEGFHWDLFHLSLAASKDGGHTWRYYSTIASPDDIVPQQKDWTEMERNGFEGPNEDAIIPLADGELMAVFRVGSFTRWKLRRSYSRDGGRTWTKAEQLPAYSVEPKLVRTANGTIALSTGRPGIHLWLSTDLKGKTWQDVDIVARHNRWAPSASYRIDPIDREHPEAALHRVMGDQNYDGLHNLLDPKNPEDGLWQSTAYTGLVEVAPNRMLLMYDRDPEQAPANPEDLSRIFVMPIEVVR